jgi:hypothetical protein
MAKNIFRGHMALNALLKNLQDFQPWQSDLQAGAFEFV